MVLPNDTIATTFAVTDAKLYVLQWFTKYLRLTLVLMRNSMLCEKFDFCFSRVFSLSLELGYDSVKFWDFPDVS